jgi:cytosol alanyl aminopeptidase
MKPSRTMKLLPALFALFLLAGCSKSDAPVEDRSTAMDEDTAIESGAPVGRLGDTVAPVHYRLELRIDPTQDSFSGTVSIDARISESLDSMWLHGKDFEVDEIFLTDVNGDRVAASYEQEHDSGVSLVSLERAVHAGAVTLEISFRRPFETGTNGLFRAVKGDDVYVATQFEPIAARKAFPGFDEPAFKVPFDLTLVTRADHVAITTTPEIAGEKLDDGYVRRVFDTTRPMPTYLLAFAVGPYDLVDYGTIPANSIRDREVPLRAIAARGLGDRLNYALENTDGILTVLEQYFGTPYPYRKLDLIAVPGGFGGAMENIGAITYNEFLLLMDENAPISQRRAYTAVHAHEIGHMWFGNLVTPEWWNDIWLNEAFASWIMFKAANAYWPEGEFDRETQKRALGAMGNDSLAAARQIREPVEHNHSISDAFDGITYQKGGGVLGMLERYVGEDGFQAGVRLHMKRHSHSTATAEDFIASVAEGSDRAEIEAAFKSFIEQPGVPLLSTRLDCADPANPKLIVSQARYAPLGSAIEPGSGQWHVPMCIKYAAGEEVKSQCVLLSDSEQAIDLEADSCPARVHPNADGAGYYRFAFDDAGWQRLIDAVPDMAPSEALALADSLQAAFRAGKVSAGTYVAGIVALVDHDTWDVADAATNHLESITNILDVEQLPDVEQAFRDIAGPRFARLPDADDAGTALLRQRMQRFLVVMAKDQAMREPLARQAAARIGLDGEPDPSAAPAGELETILSVGVQDIGEPFFDLLLEQAQADKDPAFRAAARGALARVEDPALVRKLQAMLLGGKFQGSEFLGIVFRQMGREATTELTYEWLVENYDVILEQLPDSYRARALPAFGSAFCSAERADEWQAFIEARAEQLPGYERSLAQAIETVRLCAALREAKAAELVTAFRNYR